MRGVALVLLLVLAGCASEEPSTGEVQMRGVALVLLLVLAGCASEEPEGGVRGTVTGWTPLSPSRLEVELDETGECFVAAHIGEAIVGSGTVEGGEGTITIENEESEFVEYVLAEC
jgi:ABC-type glycerol-3-phosphate transport system substrate-binding protein